MMTAEQTKKIAILTAESAENGDRQDVMIGALAIYRFGDKDVVAMLKQDEAFADLLDYVHQLESEKI